MFDVDSLVNQTVTAAGDTQRLQVPDGDWPILFEEIKIQERQHPAINDGKPFPEFRYKVLVDSQEVRDALKRDKVVHSGNFILDTTTVNGQTVLDMSAGMNVNLNQLRDALGMNNEGQEFKISMLNGGFCMATFRQKPTKDGGLASNITKFFKRG